MFPTGTVTFLFTDIQGSTSLWERDLQAMQAALEKHNTILNAAIQENGGIVFKFIGDAYQAAFDEPTGALRAALAAQRLLAAESWGATGPLRVRMGIHSGPAELRGNPGSAGADYAVSHTLNRVARIMSAGHGGQILLSLAAAELVRENLPADVQLKDLGEHCLKGMSRPERIFQALAPDLPKDFPPLATGARLLHNLPSQLTGFIGREKEIIQVQRRLAASRLVTLTGSGGVGKSRLALQVAEKVLNEFPDGVWLVELAPISNPALIPQPIAQLFGVREDKERSLEEAVADYLRSKRLLLVLDNCEHLIEACASLAEALLLACPDLHILASSREPLGVEGEVILRVPSLSLPEEADPWRRESASNPEELMRSEAVQLFVDRVQAALPDFHLSEENAAGVIQICRRLDGIPLAIELAAARARVLGIGQIAARLDDAFRLLTGGSRTALPRQQTLRAAIDWSFNLLSEPERILFRRLSVFSGGWTLEAAESICVDPLEGLKDDRLDGSNVQPADLQTENILDLLTQLTDKSLVGVEQEAGRGSRYRLLETVRQYTREKLSESGEADPLRRRHRDWFVSWVEAGLPKQKSGEVLAWMDALEADFDNLRAARDWACGEGSGHETSLRLSSGLYRYWWVRGNLGEGYEWLRHGLEAEPAHPDLEPRRALALYTLSWIAGPLGHGDEALAWAEESVSLFRQLGSASKTSLVEAMGNFAAALAARGKTEQAQSLLQEGETIARSLGSAGRWSLAMLLWWKAVIAIFVDSQYQDAETAYHCAEESWAIFQQLGDHWNAGPLLVLGEIDRVRNRHDSARSYYEQALARFEELRDRGGMARAYDGLTRLAIIQGDYRQAAAYFREGASIRLAQGNISLVGLYLENAAFFIVDQLVEGAQKQAALPLAWAIRVLGAASLIVSDERKLPNDEGTFIGWYLTSLENQWTFFGNPLTSEQRQAYQDALKGMLDQLGPGAIAAALGEGQAMNIEEAIERASEFIG